jgi:septation ring formation regulator EzrA
MDGHTRQTSSVYSNFELDELLSHITTQTREQQDHTIRRLEVERLEEENTLLQMKLSAVRDCATRLYEAVWKTMTTTTQLETLQSKMERF